MNKLSHDELGHGIDRRCIRLFELHPGEPEDPLKCDIKEVSLSQHPEYEAISYCWGLRQATDSIICNGKTYLPLTQSLSSAIRQFRHTEHTRVLWADAVCIDQDNADEKGRQVNLMKDVFRQARRVLVWLGEEKEGDSLDPYITFAERIATFDEPKLSQFDLTRRKSGKLDYEYGVALNAILERPWFRRVWITQEVALASDAVVYCGGKSLSWGAFNSVLKLEFGMNLQNDFAMEIIEGIRVDRESVSKGTKVTLLEVLLRHRAPLATDPRDKVYALLGLCNDEVVKANYKLSVPEVYMEVTKSYLRQNLDLDIITPPSNPFGRENQGGPSWVPDWSATDVAFPLAFRDRLTKNNGYQATKSSQYTCGVSDDHKLLEVDAQFLDEVMILGSVRRPYRPDAPGMQALAAQLRVEFTIGNEWQNICLGKATSWKALYPNGETLFDVSWQIILAGCRPSEYEELRKQSREIWKMHRKYLLAHRLHLLPLWAFGIIDRVTDISGQTVFFRRLLAKALMNDYFNRTQRTISHRRMMRTKNEHLGLVPALAQVGDRIALLKGMSTPAIIRPKGQHWEFVGDAYIHGIMNGEAFRPEECTSIWLA